MKISNRLPAQLFDRVSTYLDFVADMMIQLELEFAKQLDAARLEKAIALTLDAEPILSCRYVPHWRKGYWERLNIREKEIFQVTRERAEYESFRCESVDYKNGPLLKACLLQTSAGDRLLLKVDHHVTDAGGVKEIAAIISGIYFRLADNPNYQPEPNLKGSRGAWQVLREIPWYAYLGANFRFARDNLKFLFPLRTHSLPIKNGPRAPLMFVHRFLPVDHVAYLSEYGRKRNATLNDIMIAAFVRALAAAGNWDRRSQLKLMTTIDLRRYLPSGRGEAVANLSQMNGCNIGTDPGHNFESTLARITFITRRQKAGWFGLDPLIYSYLTCLPLVPDYFGKKSYQRMVQMGRKMRINPPALTNMGPIDPESVTFDTQPLNARLWPPPFYPPISGAGLSGYAGTLTLTTGVYPTQKDIVEIFFDQLIAELPCKKG